MTLRAAETLSPDTSSGNAQRGVRRIGPVLATLLVANNMIGSGVFLLPVSLAGVGSVTVLGWMLAALGAAAIALVLARLGALRPLAGGHCAYALSAFGARVGFQAYGIYWVCCVVGNLAIALAAVGYLASFFPMLAHGLPLTLASIGLIILLALLNIIGPRQVCQFDSFALAIGLIPILLVGTFGWWQFDAQLFAQSWNVGHEPVRTAVPHSLILVFWAFLGLESAAVVTAVVDNPARNVPIATVAGVSLAAVVYIAACSAIFGLVPAAKLAGSTAPFAEAATVLLGPVAGTLVAVAAITKATGTLAGWLLVTAQTGQAAADHGVFPSRMARVNARGVPVQNLLLVTLLMCAMAFATQSPTLATQFARLIEVSVLLALASYIYACLALFRLDGAGAPVVRTVYRVLAVVSCIFCVYVMAFSPPDQIAVAAALILSTIVLYPLLRRHITKKTI
jgi:arginine:agmatine antiporter